MVCKYMKSDDSILYKLGGDYNIYIYIYIDIYMFHLQIGRNLGSASGLYAVHDPFVGDDGFCPYGSTVDWKLYDGTGWVAEPNFRVQCSGNMN